jgi:hypothetical protein
MKNIHVLPTDKPSRLWMTKLGNLSRCHDIRPIKEALGNNINIYFTNDEEIKEGDWVYFPISNEVLKISNGFYEASLETVKTNEDCKKIILTTDQDLIKDGIQAIDDEFLEWYVKNPSCEGVKIDLVPVNEFGSEITVGGYGFDKFKYKIIIPTEEPKQELHICKYCGAETTQSDDECYAKPKQETLEEAKLNFCNNSNNFQGISREDLKIGWDACAKWMQERMYSEEEVKKLIVKFLFDRRIGREVENVNEWFEQFKKN